MRKKRMTYVLNIYFSSSNAVMFAMMLTKPKNISMYAKIQQYEQDYELS